ncbi:MAG: hypothetical protein GY758_34655 [Fuerstiella sp.]|jgi:hypothetical protein|nr:hypothetical protein [Fuerstiella sp.]MCP4511326.1 hypothetical protein [Fuerstiella sp.]MDG2128630.1 hypothetical protein [Fuerstiella sp.]
MIEAVANLFTRRDPGREAALGLARIISRHEMAGMSYDHGIVDDRRVNEEWHVALGVWLFPCDCSDRAEDVDMSCGVPAVTVDIRRQGFGVMTPVQLKNEYFLIAVPDEQADAWIFFRCRMRHNTKRPGNWYQLGIQVERTIDLEGSQRVAFREHIGRVEASSQ